MEFRMADNPECKIFRCNHHVVFYVTFVLADVFYSSTVLPYMQHVSLLMLTFVASPTSAMHKSHTMIGITKRVILHALALGLVRPYMHYTPTVERILYIANIIHQCMIMRESKSYIQIWSGLPKMSRSLISNCSSKHCASWHVSSCTSV